MDHRRDREPRRLLRWALALSMALAAVEASPSENPSPRLRLVDPEGAPLAGAVVVVEHDSGAVKTVTDPDGRLPLAVASGDKLTLRAEGVAGRYSTRHYVVPAESSDPLDVVLTPAGAGGTTVQSAPYIQLGELVSGNTATDGARATPPDCGAAVNAPGLWFMVLGTGDVLTASTCNQADYDTRITVFTALDFCNYPGLGCEATNDDAAGCAGFTSKVTWWSQPGLPYAILVHGFNGDAGAFDLVVTEAAVGETAAASFVPPPLGVCCTCLDSPFNCTFGITLDECLAIGGDFMDVCLDCRPTYDSSTPALAIPDNGFPAFVSDTVYVSGGTIDDVDVFVRTLHSWIGDLHHIVESPSGTQVTLWAGNCDDGPYFGIEAVFDDDGTAGSCNPDGPTPAADDGNGRIRPQGGVPLSAFNGSSAEGLWTLHSADDFPGDAGALAAWSVRINNEAAGTVCDPEDTPGSADGNVTICHCRPGGACHTMTVTRQAADAHLNNHGADEPGACE